MLSRPATEARKKFPINSLIRHKISREVLVIGKNQGNHSFWVLTRTARPVKYTITGKDLLTDFEQV